MAELVQRTAGLSGSDLKELCRNAAMIPIREYVRSVQPTGSSEDASQDLVDLDLTVILHFFYVLHEETIDTYICFPIYRK